MAFIAALFVSFLEISGFHQLKLSLTNKRSLLKIQKSINLEKSALIKQSSRSTLLLSPAASAPDFPTPNKRSRVVRARTCLRSVTSSRGSARARQSAVSGKRRTGMKPRVFFCLHFSLCGNAPLENTALQKCGNGHLVVQLHRVILKMQHL